MAEAANIYGLSWDFAIPQTLSGAQRWVLSAMQNHGPELVTMLWRILGNEQDVCDAYQDTFLKLAHHKGGQKPRNVRAYVFRSANNAAISMLRHRIAERKAVTAAEVSKAETKQNSGDINSRYLQERLRIAVAHLPEHLRNVVTLHDLGELSYRQTGRILGITASTARVYRCRAIQLLSVWMQKEQ